MTQNVRPCYPPPTPRTMPDSVLGQRSLEAYFNAPGTPPAAAVQPRRTEHDPEATVVIGRHRADGTVDMRPLPTVEPGRTRRGGWLGRVTAAAVARLRRGGGERDA